MHSLPSHPPAFFPSPLSCLQNRLSQTTIDQLPFHRPTRDAKHRQNHETQGHDHCKAYPVGSQTINVGNVDELRREISCHQRNGHEKNSYLGKEYSYACESLDCLRFLERYETEILCAQGSVLITSDNLSGGYQKDQRFLLVEAFLYFAERVEVYSIAKAFESHGSSRGKRGSICLNFWSDLSFLEHSIVLPTAYVMLIYCARI